MGSDVILVLLVLAGWLAGFAVLGGLLSRRATATAPDGVRRRADTARLSLIVPARNEEGTLPRLLGSLAAQTIQPREIIVVDDHSTDRTAEVARQFGATVLASQPLPEGWRGKTWACQQGANCAHGDLLLFVDADAWFEVAGLEHIIAEYATGALSVGPYHCVQKPYEQLSALFNVIMAAGTVPHGLFGQMLLVDGDSYRRVGGHEAVKGRILENFCLAGQFRAAGIPLRSLVGKGMLSFRMYPNGLPELVQGWTKGFASGAGHTAKPTLLLIVVWLIGMSSSIVGLPFTVWTVALYLLFAAQLAIVFRQVGTYRWYAALLYPVPLAFFFGVFTWSVLRSGRSVTWKGRTIRAD